MYKFQHNAEFYYSLYEKYRADGKLDKASEYLLETIRLNNKLSYHVELASLYSEMDQLIMSNDECFYVLSRDSKNFESISILSTNYSELKNYRAAYYYFNQYDDYGLEELADMMLQDSEFSDFSKLGFKLVYSNGRKDCSAQREDAEVHIGLQNYAQSIEILNSIPKNCTQYIWAQKMLVYCYYMIEDYERALEISKSLMKSSNSDVSMLAITYNILMEREEIDSAKDIVDKMAKIQCYDVHDVIKASYCLMDSKRYTEAIHLVKRERVNYLYDDSIILLLATAYYMEGDTDKAKYYIIKLIKMYGNRTYARYYLETFNNKEVFNGEIFNDIPSVKAIQMSKEIEEKYNQSSKVFEVNFLYNNNFRNMVNWRIMTDATEGYAYALIDEIASYKNSLGKHIARDFLERLLITDKLNGDIKASILSHLIYFNYTRTIPFVYDNYFRVINTVNCKRANAHFVDAYAMCCVYLAPILKDYEDEIYAVYNEILVKLGDNIKRMRSPEAIAALILYNCGGLELSKDQKIITGLFGANIQTFRKYLNYLN